MCGRFIPSGERRDEKQHGGGKYPTNIDNFELGGRWPLLLRHKTVCIILMQRGQTYQVVRCR